MLSAGICILLNLTFMDVDTSGLPPDLQNDDGKKVVGIILICVAVASLGLSMTVSIVYFFICGKTDNKPPTNSTSGKQDGKPTSKNNSYQPNGSAVSNGRHRSQRTSTSQVSVHSQNSQTSRRLSSPDSASSASSVNYRSRHKKIRQKHKHRTNLPTHTEEDPESARSVADLKQGRSTFYVDRPVEDESDAGTSERKLTPPIIVVDNHSTLTSTPTPKAVVLDSVDSLISETAFIEDEQQTQSNLPTRGGASRSLSSDFDQESISNSEKVTSDKNSSSEYNKQISFASGGLDTMSLDSEFSSVSHQHSEDPLSSQQRGQNQQNKVPSKSGHSGLVSAKIGDRHNDNLDMQSDSQSSFNSAFSLDGGDPQQSDIEHVQQNNKNLLIERL